MRNKYKLLIKQGIISVAIGVVAAAAVFIIFNLYINQFTLDIFQQSLADKMRLTAMIMWGVTAAFVSMNIQLGIEERKNEKLWREQNRQMAKDYNADIKGVNLAGLIDDSQKKEFCTIFGERIRMGEDHGTMYLLFKTLMVFALFMTVTTTMVMVFMLLSLR